MNLSVVEITAAVPPPSHLVPLVLVTLKCVTQLLFFMWKCLPIPVNKWSLEGLA